MTVPPDAPTAEGGGAPSDEMRLDDPAVPFDKESVARALGASIRRRHDLDPTGVPLVLAALADGLVEAAAAVEDRVVDSGPYLGRSITKLARLAAESVEVLPPSSAAPVDIRPGLTLGDCVVRSDGSVRVDGPMVRGDREVELAGAAIEMAMAYGTAVVAPLLDAYGMDVVDLRRLDTCQLLLSVAGELDVDVSTFVADQGAVDGFGG